MGADYRQQEECEQEQHERLYPPPFSDEWYARMNAAHQELKQTVGEMNQEGWSQWKQ